MRFSSFYTSANTANTLSPFAKEGSDHFFDQPEYDSNQQVAEEERPFAEQSLLPGSEEEQGSPASALQHQQYDTSNYTAPAFTETGPVSEEEQPAAEETGVNEQAPAIEKAPVTEQETKNTFAETFSSGPAGENLNAAIAPDANGPMPFAENFNIPDGGLPSAESNVAAGNTASLTKDQVPAGMNSKGVEELAQGEGELSGLLPAGAPQEALSGESSAMQEDANSENAPGETAEASAQEPSTTTAATQSTIGQPADEPESSDQPVAAGTSSAPTDAPAATTDSDAMNRINSGRDVDFKPRIQAQAGMINADSDLTELSIMQQASERRARVTGLFTNSRQTITDAIEGNALAVQSTILSQQANILTMAANAITSVQALISMATASAQALVLNYQQAINAIITNATQTVQDGVNGVATEISGLINSINLPDLPGVELARSFITGMITTGAGLVNNALAGVIGLIRSVFNMGVAMMTAFIGIFGQMLSQAFSFVSNALMNMLQLVLSMLNSIMNLVVNTLLNLLHGTLLPITGRIESAVLKHIDESEQEHLKQVRNNRDQHLEILANVLDPEAAGSGGSGGGAGATGSGASPDPGWTIEKVGLSAIDNNKKLLENFLKVLDSIFGNILVDITTAVMRIVAEVSGRVNQFINSLINVMMRLVELIFALVNAVVEFVAMLLSELIRVLSGLLDFIVNAISSPVTTTINAARNILNRVRSAIASIINNFLNQIGLGSGPSLSPPVLSPSPGGVSPAFAGGPILIIGGKIIIIIGTGF
ncbi:MAG: hypothetical protein ACTHMC_13155, partial [Pseudobacter sp.]|uniref:hypothetical protein n=1 Tax=Pseudobacter sp. TaxID=2045420 RepID=UPI003F82290D